MGLLSVDREEPIANTALAQAWRLNQRRLERDVDHFALQLEQELRTRIAIGNLESNERQLEARRQAWEFDQAACRDAQARDVEARRMRVAAMAEQISSNAQRLAMERERQLEARLEVFANEKEAYSMDRSADAEARANYAASVVSRANALMEERCTRSARQQAHLLQRREEAGVARAVEQARQAEKRRAREAALMARQREHEIQMEVARRRKEDHCQRKMARVDEFKAFQKDVVEEMARQRRQAANACDELRELAFQAAVTGRVDVLYSRLAELSPRMRSPSQPHDRPLSARGVAHQRAMSPGQLPRGSPGLQRLAASATRSASVHTPRKSRQHGYAFTPRARGQEATHEEDLSPSTAYGTLPLPSK